MRYLIQSGDKFICHGKRNKGYIKGSMVSAMVFEDKTKAENIIKNCLCPALRKEATVIEMVEESKETSVEEVKKSSVEVVENTNSITNNASKEEKKEVKEIKEVELHTKSYIKKRKDEISNTSDKKEKRKYTRCKKKNTSTEDKENKESNEVKLNYQFWIDKLYEFNELITLAKSRKPILEMEESVGDKKVQDALHSIEFSKNKNVCKGNKSYMILREILRDRRAAKDELITINPFSEIDLTDVMNSMKSRENIIKNRCYKPKVLPELFEEGCEGIDIQI